MNDNKISCCLCLSNKERIIYQGRIRSGEFGQLTDKEHQVVECSQCQLVRLAHNPNSSEFYQTSEYRDSYNNTSNPNDYIAMHDCEQPERIQDIGIDAFRHRVVLDIGCGGGAFLDQVSGVSKRTIAIEPYKGYQGSLLKRGHSVYLDVDAAIVDLKSSVDTIVSFGVIEHVDDPFYFLSSAFSLLKPGGKFYLETDNLNDILMSLPIPEFPQFFYRTAHLWYFCEKTLVALAKKAGFGAVRVSYRHNFDLSNVLMWACQGKPTGTGKIEQLDKRINLAWKNFVIELGAADLICLELTKE